MHTLVVIAHPDNTSYTHAALGRLIDGIKSNQAATYDIIDLVEDGFDPRFTLEDNDIYNGRTSVGPELKAYQERIDQADTMVLLFPIYWWSMPALMKGWIDRVFSSGWAFEDDVELGTTRLLTRLCGKIIAVGGSKRQTYERRGYLDAINKQISEGIFEFCGMQNLGSELLLPLDNESKRAGLERAYSVGTELVHFR